MFVSLHCHAHPDWEGVHEHGAPTSELGGSWWPGNVHPNWISSWDVDYEQVRDAVVFADHSAFYP